MKKKEFETLMGGARAQNLSPDAMQGLNALAHRLTRSSEDDELFQVAVKRATDEELQKLARFRLEAQRAKYLD